MIPNCNIEKGKMGEIDLASIQKEPQEEPWKIFYCVRREGRLVTY
jgi:hypothetical protein